MNAKIIKFPNTANCWVNNFLFLTIWMVFENQNVLCCYSGIFCTFAYCIRPMSVEIMAWHNGKKHGLSDIPSDGMYLLFPVCGIDYALEGQC